MEAEGGSKGEIIVGPGGEALKPPGKHTLQMKINSVFCVILEKSVYYRNGLIFFSIVEALEEENNDGTEEPQSTTLELGMFDWVRAQMEKGSLPTLEKVTPKACSPK